MKSICLCLLMGFCLTATAQPLNQNRVEAFAQTIVEALLSHPREMVQYLADDVQVEAKVCNNLNGVTFKYNKQEYAKVLQDAKYSLSNQQRYGKLRLHDVTVSQDIGEFAMSIYVKSGKYKGWLTFSVEEQAQEIKITRLAVEI